jgi:hypothetical protein
MTYPTSGEVFARDVMERKVENEMYSCVSRQSKLQACQLALTSDVPFLYDVIRTEKKHIINIQKITQYSKTQNIKCSLHRAPEPTAGHCCFREANSRARNRRHPNT